jgi:hypothetical protein
MPAQGGCWRNAENEVDAIGAAPVVNAGVKSGHAAV